MINEEKKGCRYQPCMILKYIKGARVEIGGVVLIFVREEGRDRGGWCSWETFMVFIRMMKSN